MASKQNLLIFGSTGYVGSYITAHIVKAKSSFGRIAIFTSPSTLANKAATIEQLKSEGAEIIVGDVSKEEDILKAFEGINTIVSAVGRPVIASQIPWIKLAERVPSITRIFPSEFGTDIDYDASSANEIPHQLKLKVRAALREAKGLEYTYVVTGPYGDPANFSNAGAEGLGGFDVLKKKGTLVGDGNGKVSFTTLNDVGKLAVKALLHPEVTRNKALKVNSFTATPLEILAEFEKQTGGDKWTVSYTSLEKLKELENEAHASGNPAAAVFTLRRIWAEGGTLYEKRENGIIDGEDTDSLEDAVREAINFQTEKGKL